MKYHRRVEPQSSLWKVCFRSLRTWRFMAPLGCLSAWCRSDARYKHGTTAEMEHRHREGLCRLPASARDESWHGSSSLATCGVDTERRGRLEAIESRAGYPKRRRRGPRLSGKLECRTAVELQSCKLPLSRQDGEKAQG